MPYNPNKYQKDLNGGWRARRVITPSSADIPADRRAPAFLVTESGNYTIKLDSESTAVATPWVTRVVYGMWLAGVTTGPSGNARVHLLYPESF